MIFDPSSLQNQLRMCQESDKTYESSVHIHAILSAPPPVPLLRSRPGCFDAPCLGLLSLFSRARLFSRGSSVRRSTESPPHSKIVFGARKFSPSGSHCLGRWFAPIDIYRV